MKGQWHTIQKSFQDDLVVQDSESIHDLDLPLVIIEENYYKLVDYSNKYLSSHKNPGAAWLAVFLWDPNQGVG